MGLLALGLNHKLAPLSIREQWSFDPEKQQDLLKKLVQEKPINEAILLTTCNRTELYCQMETPEDVLGWLHERYFPTADLSSYFYQHRESTAIQHLLRVATGLDSMALGESQIFAQLKQAYQQGMAWGTVGKSFQQLFQYVFSVAKQVRATTEIGRHPISIAFLAAKLAKNIFSDLKQATVLLLGSGQTTELVANYLSDMSVKQIIVAGRSRQRAHDLAARVGGLGIGLSDIHAHLSTADIVVSATSSPLPVLGKGSIETALKQRKYRPMLLIDVAVPRDIEPEVGHLDDVYLYNLDDLQAVVAQSTQHRETAAHAADEMIQAYVEYYLRHLQTMDTVRFIRAYRDKMNHLVEQDLQKALLQIERGKAPGLVLQHFAKSVMNKFMHDPCTQIREAGYHGQLEALHFAKLLLGLNIN